MCGSAYVPRKGQRATLTKAYILKKATAIMGRKPDRVGVSNRRRGSWTWEPVGESQFQAMVRLGMHANNIGHEGSAYLAERPFMRITWWNRPVRPDYVPFDGTTE